VPSDRYVSRINFKNSKITVVINIFSTVLALCFLLKILCYWYYCSVLVFQSFPTLEIFQLAPLFFYTD